MKSIIMEQTLANSDITTQEQTIGELRNKFVDYTDTTPNEPRYIKDNILDSAVFYPLGNIYPKGKLPILNSTDDKTFKEEFFLNNYNMSKIKFAIAYLQPKALQKFMTKNFTNILLGNPFYHLFYTVYPIHKNIEATKEIIKILIDNYDDYYNLITNLRTPKPEQKYILDLLYSFLPNDENNICSICLTTEPKHLLINPCLCKTPIHTDCLIKLSTFAKLDKCKVCLGKYMINEPIYRTMSGIQIKETIDKTIFFPYHDLYYEPLLSSSSLYKFTGMSRLTMAIMYLQVDRVKQLLQEKEVLDALPNYYFGYERFEQTPLMVLAKGNMPSNAHIRFGDNWKKYVLISKMLYDTKKIDLDKKDAFDKTARDYLNENTKMLMLFIKY
jgi:hypothetical protein